MQSTSPSSVDSLLTKANHIAGWSLGELAQSLAIEVPEDLRRHKGWAGQLLELWLGASAGSKPEPDFPHLGVELKTIPIDRCGNPLESTYICVCPLTGLRGLKWEDSVVNYKLSKVLWIPIVGERAIPPGERQIGMPLLWSPDESERSQLKRDWEELTEQVALGQIEHISAHQGEILQIRPKAANRKALTDAIGPDGLRIQTYPRGYYLRSRFTKALIRKHYL